MDFFKRFAAPLAIVVLTSALFTTNELRAQEKPTLLPSPAGRVNDYAGVMDASVKERMQNMLANLKERGGIEFAVVTVKSTEGKEIFDYSLQVAREWNVGSMQSTEDSVLLVLSTDDGKYFTQVSRGFRGDMPDGLIGEIASRMRAPVGSANYNEALMIAVQTFIAEMAVKRSFSVEGIEQAPSPSAQAAQQVAESEPSAAPKEATTEVAAPSDPAAKEPATTGAPSKQRSLREIFTRPNAAKEPATKSVVVPRDAPERAELDAIMQLVALERIEKLKGFIETHPRSGLNPLAIELLVSAHAALGDEKLRAGDAEGGVAQFSEAIAKSPDKMSDALFVKVVSQIPTNLYMRGQRSTSFEAARFIEAKVKDDAKRLLMLAGFYLSVERADEAARLSEQAIQLVPEMATAHQALGAARHIALRLDDAATEYARALELDPKLTSARRSLADLRRAAGKTEEATALYRELLTSDPADKAARAGLVLALLDFGKREEAELELANALKTDESNLPLLVGLSYWYAAHNEPLRAQELATKAVQIEQRYTWAHIALARALVALKRPLEAERVLRFARRFGKFPTLDYELASALAASGLYDEAAIELGRSFSIKDGQIETRLAGSIPAHDASFTEVLAPERRAGIFQSAAADTESNARMLKGLLSLSSALNMGEGQSGSVDRARLDSALQDFLAGEDATRTYRQIYAANRLLQRGVELPKVIELAEAASIGVEAALTVPTPTLAVMADELRDARARAISADGVLPIKEVQTNILANILRGRIEDLIGWSLFNQDKLTEALTHLRRAISVLPESTAWRRKAEWHLGAALEASGSLQEALAAYMKSYNPSAPDPVRRVIIEALYRKVNGSLDGLDAKIGPGPTVGRPSSQPESTSVPVPTETPKPTPTPEPSATPPPATQTQSPPTTDSMQTAPPNEPAKPESTEQKRVEGTHPVKP